MKWFLRGMESGWLSLVITLVAMSVMGSNVWCTTFYVAKNGSDTAAGTSSAPLLTVQAGINKAYPGDTVYVRAGIYRQRLTFPRNGAPSNPITLTGDPGAIIDGGILQTGWQRVSGSGNLWRIPWSGDDNDIWNFTCDNKYILHINRDVMATAEGMNTLTSGPLGWDTYDGTPYRSWDGVWAMCGYQSGYLYVGFGDPTSDPTKMEITTAARAYRGGSTITISGRQFITVRGLTVRNGYYGIYVCNNSSDCVIEYNTVTCGFDCVEIESGSSRILVRRNELTLGYVHTLDTDNPRHWFMWAVFKLVSDTDRGCVELDNIGSDVEICENHMFENFDGVENTGSSLRLNVHHNLIESLSDDGLEPCGDETEAQWHHNTVKYANIAYRHKMPYGSAGPMYVYDNLFYSRPGKVYSENKGIYWFCGNTTTAYIYHNTFATTVGAGFGSTDPQYGLPNVWLVNNIFSSGMVDHYDNSNWPVKPHVEYNYWGGDLSTGLSWWGSSNKVVQNGQLWNQASEPDYQLSSTSPARQVGIDISKSWTISGVTNPALPGFAPGYFGGTFPDAGANQYLAWNPWYFDDFESDALGNMPAGWIKEAGNWSVVNSARNGSKSHVYQKTDTNSSITLVDGTAPLGWTNYSVQALVHVGERAHAGVLSRANDVNNCYAFVISDFYRRWKWDFYRKANGNWIRLMGGFCARAVSDWANIRLTSDGMQHKCEIAPRSGRFTTLGIYTDSYFTSGTAGLIGGGGRVSFDDVRIIGE